MTSIEIADIDLVTVTWLSPLQILIIIIAHAEFVFLLTIINSIIRTRC